MPPPSPIAVLPLSRTELPRVAVLLNANARAVGPKVVRALRQVVPEDDLFVSHDLDEAERIVAQVAERGYDVVLTGGGDGTFVGFLNALVRQLDAPEPGPARGPVPALARRPLPQFGVLRLGTGNALALLTGASPLRKAGVARDILDVRSGRTLATRRLDLVEAEGVRAPFVGLGWDALVLNNYGRWKRMLSATPFRPFGEALWGYALSVTFLSIPEVMRGWRPTEVEVINRGAEAWEIDVAGRPVGDPVPEGGLLYRGPVTVAGAGTCPVFGFGFKMYPAACALPGRMQLRISHAGVQEAVSHLPTVWRGEYRSGTIHDFHVQRVELVFDRPMPFQIGGDGAGLRERVELSVGDRPVELIEFPGARSRLGA